MFASVKNWAYLSALSVYNDIQQFIVLRQQDKTMNKKLFHSKCISKFNLSLGHKFGRLSNIN